MRRIALIVLVIALAASPGFSQFAKVGSSGLQFLDIPVSTRAVGMGNVFSAVANDASTLFWNPAGMENLPFGAVYAGTVQWPADINLHAVSGAMNVEGVGHFGLSFLMLDVGLMTRNDVFNPEGNGGTFGVEDWALGLSYSRSLTERFAIGVTLKWVHEKLADWEDDGWAVDLGGYYDTGFNGITLGFAIMNFGPDLRYDVDEDGDGLINEDPLDGSDNDGDNFVDEDTEEAPVPLPIQFRFGINIPVINAGDSKLDVAAEITHPNDNKELYSLGAEYWFMNMVALRGGYSLNVDTGSGVFAGAGFRLGVGDVNLMVDYAFADMGILDFVHRASVGFSF